MISKVILVAGVARSGTSWIGQVINSHPKVRYQFQPLFSYEFRGSVNEDSSPEEFGTFFKDLFQADTEFLGQKDKVAKGIYPDFKKDNPNILSFKENKFQSVIPPLLRKRQDVHLVGIIRNPCAVLLSWTKNKSEFPEGSDIMEEWRFAACKNKGPEDYFGYYKWKEVANLYLDLKQQFPERVSILSYEELLNAPEEKFKGLFERLDLDYSEQTAKFVTESTAGRGDNYYSVYTGGVNKDKWKSELPSVIVEEIYEDLKATRLEQFLQ
ncbi:sulfotransferase [Gilvibacter sp.]|uniref:sulfotransferase n=1 Tax=Gilvibacter sp. TaxID=2729997 RepID=UPI003F49B4B0